MVGINFADQMSPEVRNAVSEFHSQFDAASYLLHATAGTLNSSATYGLVARKAVEIFVSCAEQLSQEISNQLPRCHDVNALGAEGQVATEVLRPLIKVARAAIPDAREVSKQRGLLNTVILEQAIQQHASTLNEKIDIKQAQIRRAVEQRRAEIDREQKAAAEKAENERWQRRHHKASTATFQHAPGVRVSKAVATKEANEVDAPSQERRVPLVFLCHASEDKKLAKEVADSLRSNGIDVWLDQWEIRTGDSLPQKINEGLGDCTHFLALLTPTALTKSWVKREIDAGFIRMLGENIRFLPVRAGLQVAELPPLIRPMYSPEINDLSTDLQQLINDIHGITRKPPLGPPPAAARSTTQSSVSPAATALARAFVEGTERATRLDPQPTKETLIALTGLTQDDLTDAIFELGGMVREIKSSKGGVVSAEPELYAAFDALWKTWDPAEDALQLASDLHNDPTFPHAPRDIAERYGWAPRRLNPALAYLMARELVETLPEAGDGTFLTIRVLATDATRRFVKSRSA